MARRPPPQFAHSATRSLVLTLIRAGVIGAAPATSTERADNPSPAEPPVPAGQYARVALMKLGLSPQVIRETRQQ